jgi:peptidyl-prolyl cis-trans isomerase SurA
MTLLPPGTRFLLLGLLGPLFFCLALLLLLPAPCQARVVDRIVAIVNDDVISLYDLNQEMKPFVKKIKSMGYPEDKEKQTLYKLRSQILNRLIDQRLADQEARRMKISVSDEEVHNTIERIKQAGQGTDEDLRNALAAQGITMAEYREKVRDQLLKSRLVNREIKSKIAIPPEEIKAYYESHPEEFGGQKVYHLYLIFKQFPVDADEGQKEAVEQELKDALQKVRAGEVSFSALAEAISDAPQASSGGYLGAFELKDLSQQLRPLLAGMKDDDMTPILKSDQGLQVFWIEKIDVKTGKTLEEATSEIERKLYNQKVNEKYQVWIQELRNKSAIKIIE